VSLQRWLVCTTAIGGAVDPAHIEIDRHSALQGRF
jgi:hypothetical protein